MNTSFKFIVVVVTTNDNALESNLIDEFMSKKNELHNKKRARKDVILKLRRDESITTKTIIKT